MRKRSPIIVIVCLCLAAWLTAVSYYHTHKALPEGLEYQGEIVALPEQHIEFVHDLRWVDADGTIHHEQRIFDSLFELIEGAERYILIDMFLFNSYGGRVNDFHRNLSSELTSLLVQKKKKNPDITIDFITDPINTVYGGTASEEIARLRQAGVNVIITRLERLRDSNFIYSSIWRTFVQWFGNSSEGGWLPHPFTSEGDKVSMRSYLRLLNFKANHRKVAIVDTGEQMTTMVSSANPHGGSSAHSNVAVVVRGPIWRSAHEAEAAVAEMSGAALSDFNAPPGGASALAAAHARIITEHQIKQALLRHINSAAEGDVIKIAQFYLADRDLIDALVDAALQGVEIKVVLDPNKDAFGFEKNGIPNRQAGSELVRRSGGNIALRWYDTHGEQFHTKLFILESGDTITVLLGSANLTRRNLDNFNLELDVELSVDVRSATAVAIGDYFDRIWTNEYGLYTMDVEAYTDDSRIKRVIYRVQERFGLSTF